MMEEDNMSEIINYEFTVRLVLTVFMAAFSAVVIFKLFVITKKVDNCIVKRTLRVVLSSLLVCLWLWVFCYKLLYPISLAKYEYDHDICETKEGIVCEIKRTEKSQIKITIDDVVYTVLGYNTDQNSVFIEKELRKGDFVSFQYGKNSHYVFLISKQTQNHETEKG